MVWGFLARSALVLSNCGLPASNFKTIGLGRRCLICRVQLIK